MKEYIKPDLFYENFELSHSVAAACSVTGDDVNPKDGKFDGANENDANSCTYDLGMLIFAKDSGLCEVALEDFTDKYCYQTNADGMRLFHS